MPLRPAVSLYTDSPEFRREYDQLGRDQFLYGPMDEDRRLAMQQHLAQDPRPLYHRPIGVAPDGTYVNPNRPLGYMSAQQRAEYQRYVDMDPFEDRDRINALLQRLEQAR